VDKAIKKQAHNPNADKINRFGIYSFLIWVNEIGVMEIRERIQREKELVKTK
jgi:hypothetical protein